MSKLKLQIDEGFWGGVWPLLFDGAKAQTRDIVRNCQRAPEKRESKDGS